MNIDSLFSHIDQKPESGILYIVGTPIGNLYDISLRALNTLKNVSLIACEDTRQTQKIMNKYSIKNNLISFNMHNSIKKIPIIINQLKKGESIALVSDAGMPSICDPGENLVKEVKLNKLKTARLMSYCCQAVAICANKNKSVEIIMQKIGESIGEIFQINDDFADFPRMSKVNTEILLNYKKKLAEKTLKNLKKIKLKKKKTFLLIDFLVDLKV